MAEWIETDRGPVDADCWHGCPRPAHWARCDVDGCCCECRDRDGTPPDVLQATYERLMRERYGPTFSGPHPVSRVTSGNTPAGREIHRPSTGTNHSNTPRIHMLSTAPSTGVLVPAEQRKHTGVTSERGR